MSYTYKVIPFMGHIKSNQGASDVSAQLESLINQHAVDGWEFYELDEVNIAVSPGCLAGLFGRPTVYTKYDQVIFRQPTA